MQSTKSKSSPISQYFQTPRVNESSQSSQPEQVPLSQAPDQSPEQVPLSQAPEQTQPVYLVPVDAYNALCEKCKLTHSPCPTCPTMKVRRPRRKQRCYKPRKQTDLQRENAKLKYRGYDPKKLTPEQRTRILEQIKAVMREQKVQQMIRKKEREELQKVLRSERMVRQKIARQVKMQKDEIKKQEKLQRQVTAQEKKLRAQEKKLRAKQTREEKKKLKEEEKLKRKEQGTIKTRKVNEDFEAEFERLMKSGEYFVRKTPIPTCYIDMMKNENIELDQYLSRLMSHYNEFKSGSFISKVTGERITIPIIIRSVVKQGVIVSGCEKPVTKSHIYIGHPSPFLRRVGIEYDFGQSIFVFHNSCGKYVTNISKILLSSDILNGKVISAQEKSFEQVVIIIMMYILHHFGYSYETKNGLVFNTGELFGESYIEVFKNFLISEKVIIPVD